MARAPILKLAEDGTEVSIENGQHYSPYYGRKDHSPSCIRRRCDCPFCSEGRKICEAACMLCGRVIGEAKLYRKAEVKLPKQTRIVFLHNMCFLVAEKREREANQSVSATRG